MSLKTKYLTIPIILLAFIFSCSGPEKNQEPIANDISELKEELPIVEEPVEKVLNCNYLPVSYASYNEAISKIRQADFQIVDGITTTSSSWIRGASYFSCNGTTGFLIIKTDKKDYIHSGVPINIWNGFKNSGSFGSYYDRNIKHNFYFKLK